MKLTVILPLIGALIIGIIIGIIVKGCGTETPLATQTITENGGEKILLWTCSMHPQIKQDRPGRCPICEMDLIPMREDAGGRGMASLVLGDRAQQLASVKTTPVVYKRLTKSIYTVGKIDYDETKISHVTARIGGRIDKLYVNFTGTNVQKDGHLVYIYSPELVTTQEEYMIAYRGAKRLQDAPIPETSSTSIISLLGDARSRLVLWGITEDQIRELERTQKVQTHQTIYAPTGGIVVNKNVFEGMYVNPGDRLFTIADLSRVWLYLNIYEYDIPCIKYGQDVEVSTESFPGTIFHGRIVFIDPFLDEITRTVKVRVNMDNPEGMLKPGMYANAAIKAQIGGEGVMLDPDLEGKYMCPMHPDVVSDKEGVCSICGMSLKRVGEGLGLFPSGLIPQYYKCPKNCPDSRSDKSGKCTACGVVLEAVAVPEIYYTCEMHPEIRQPDPGSCPKCNMKLTKRESKMDEGHRHIIYVCSEDMDEQSKLPDKCPTCNKQMVEKSGMDVGVIAVPHSAVLYTGLRNIVYVEVEDGNYVPREVVLGVKADEYYHVISGLEVGERVVTSGAFLIDSQMQLLGKPSLLFPEGS